jgi:3'(2'), 5'-bisphosphate nucleotidase
MLTSEVGFRKLAQVTRPGDDAAMTATARDHELAAQLAVAAARLLLDVRARLVAEGADERTLRAEGDRSSHELLMAGLHQHAPDDCVLSEEADGSREAGDHARLSADRVWIIDPLDGTREFGEADRGDWAVHVALAIGGTATAGAVALPAQGLVLGTQPAPPAPPAPPDRMRPRIVVSRTRPPALAEALAERLDGTLVPMGSAGAKAMAIVLGGADIYVHEGGQYEWDSAAPVAVANAAGLHTSRTDGSPLRYNNADPLLPDLLICRPELADTVLATIAALRP